jgi:AcrR family transcriptional regulator
MEMISMELSATQRKEYVIIVAIDLINEKGFHYVSTKEIAKRLGVSEGLIFKIFPKKSDMLKAVLERFSLYDNDIFRTAEVNYDNALDGIEFTMNKFLDYYEHYPAITAIYQAYDTLQAEPELNGQVKYIYCNRREAYIKALTKAWDSGLIKKDIEPETIADILNSIMIGMCQQWRMQDFGFSLKDKTWEAMDLLIDSIRKGEADGRTK